MTFDQMRTQLDPYTTDDLELILYAASGGILLVVERLQGSWFISDMLKKGKAVRGSGQRLRNAMIDAIDYYMLGRSLTDVIRMANVAPVVATSQVDVQILSHIAHMRGQMDGAFETIKLRLDALDGKTSAPWTRPTITEDMIRAFVVEWYGNDALANEPLPANTIAYVTSALNAAFDAMEGS